MVSLATHCPNQSTLMLDFMLWVIKSCTLRYNWKAAEGQKNVSLWPLVLYFIPRQKGSVDRAVVAQQSEPVGWRSQAQCCSRLRWFLPPQGVTGCPGWIFTSSQLSDFSLAVFYTVTWWYGCFG